MSVTAAAEGRPQIALGDALGSNVTNLGLVLGLAALVAAVRVPRDAGVRDVPVVLLAPLGTALLAADGRISRLDGALLLAAFTAWLLAVVRPARHERSAAAGTLGEPGGGRRAARAAAGGLVSLVVAGLLIVDAAAAIGVALGMDAFVVGATLVAVETSAPELATTLTAKLRGHDEVGLGTLPGSNIFNGLCIVGVAAVIAPIAVPWSEVQVGLAFGALVVLASLPLRGPDRPHAWPAAARALRDLRRDPARLRAGPGLSAPIENRRRVAPRAPIDGAAIGGRSAPPDQSDGG